MKVEVLKTSVLHADEAKRIIDRIHATFINCHANFDLDDCDRILRVESDRAIQAADLISILNACGFDADVLPDDIPNFSSSENKIQF